MDSKLLSHLIKIANDAGEAIMAIHKKPSNFEIKSDNTPVTKADNASNQIISVSYTHLTLPTKRIV